LMLLVFKQFGPDLPFRMHQIIWSVGAVYLACAAVRLARFNVSNKHGEQHHFSFLGLPSPGAAAAVAGVVLMQQELRNRGWSFLADMCVLLLPVLVGVTGFLMISSIRYPHMVNRYLRGKHSIARLVVALTLLLLLVVAHQYTVGVASVAYALWGPASYLYVRFRRKSGPTGKGGPTMAGPVV